VRTTTSGLVLGGAILVGGAAAATSAISLYGIAVKCGIPEPWAAANPIALDAGAAVAALAWITQDGPRRVWGRGTALGALAASLVENGLDHALTSGLLQLNLLLVLAVSGCIPAMLFGVIHLAALMARDEPEKPRVERAPRKPTVKSLVESSAGTTTPPVVPAAPSELTERRDAAGTATEWARKNWPCTAREIQDETGVRKSSAHRIRNKVAEEMTA
jgi:hypothetical protein